MRRLRASSRTTATAVLRQALEAMERPASRGEVALDSASAAPQAAAGTFVLGTFSNPAGRRAYKLYVPRGCHGQALPLVVMLHGCRQDADDFAAGTGMNLLADRVHCLVLYPQQERGANGANCWNWFGPAHQAGAGGEPAILAGMTRQVIHEHGADPDRVYVAGLSAGGAMAAILAGAFPDLYAAVGIHSGLPAGAARDAASAFAVMKDASKAGVLPPYRRSVPAIVFHGDRDRTVAPANGRAALAQSMALQADVDGTLRWRGKVETVPGISGAGRGYTRKIYRDGDGRVVAEHWQVHGAGHAWSGGRQAGSFTDSKGPDASGEMVRFFLEHPRSPAAAPAIELEKIQ
ncbi:MAG: PHB depolymerase family esterase [Burkholderiaceae bacterium]